MELRALLLDRRPGDLLALYGDRSLARPDGRSPGTIDEFLEQLNEAKEKGYTESPVDLADGIWALAAPVRSAAGRIVAAWTASFLGEPTQDKDFHRMIAVLLRGAEEISSRRLGHRPCGLSRAKESAGKGPTGRLSWSEHAALSAHSRAPLRPRSILARA